MAQMRVTRKATPHPRAARRAVPRVLLVVGTRPNFIKAVALMRAFAAYRHDLEVRLVHTDQHYDRTMSAVFFRDLRLPPPDVHLGVRARCSAGQIGRTLMGAERCFRQWAPDLVVVFGDVNSTLGAALAARTLQIPLAHVEAGLRSFDDTMPEELNRRLTDAMADYLFTPCRDANRNLVREGIDPRRIFLVGDVMTDTLRMIRPLPSAALHRRFGVRRRKYAVMTLHRAGNVDHPETLARVLGAVVEVSTFIPLVFPRHPRTGAHWRRLIRRDVGLARSLDEATAQGRLRIAPPLGYREFQRLLRDARFVMTDSGGIQEEASVLDIPCLTLRENTERPNTVAQGTNRLVGTDPKRILREVARILDGGGKRRRLLIEQWDGHAAERIAAILHRSLLASSAPPPRTR
jgi:UDP-N-acetylglucosamine 2-epimerase (non-hydrolysing)